MCPLAHPRPPGKANGVNFALTKLAAAVEYGCVMVQLAVEIEVGSQLCPSNFPTPLLLGGLLQSHRLGAHGTRRHLIGSPGHGARPL